LGIVRVGGSDHIAAQVSYLIRYIPQADTISDEEDHGEAVHVCRYVGRSRVQPSSRSPILLGIRLTASLRGGTGIMVR